MKHLDIVLVEPRIPQNTGNIARTCSATGASLHLIKPLGFEIDDAKLKRAGLDYWNLLDIHYYENIDDFFTKNPEAPKVQHIYFTTKGCNNYAQTDYSQWDRVYLVFGREDKGLPEDLLFQHPGECVRLPMRKEARSLNLSNTVAIGVYETLRQWDFPELLQQGQLTTIKWENNKNE